MSHREPHAATEPRTGTVMGMRGCESATECSSDRPGHRLHAMQQRLAATTASKWRDGFVVATDVAGFATIADLEGDAIVARLAPRRVRRRAPHRRPGRRALDLRSARPGRRALQRRVRLSSHCSLREPPAHAIGIASLIAPIIFSSAMAA